MSARSQAAVARPALARAQGRAHAWACPSARAVAATGESSQDTSPEPARRSVSSRSTIVEALALRPSGDQRDRIPKMERSMIIELIIKLLRRILFRGCDVHLRISFSCSRVRATVCNLASISP